MQYIGTNLAGGSVICSFHRDKKLDKYVVALQSLQPDSIIGNEIEIHLSGHELEAFRSCLKMVESFPLEPEEQQEYE